MAGSYASTSGAAFLPLVLALANSSELRSPYTTVPTLTVTAVNYAKDTEERTRGAGHSFGH